MQKHIKIMKKLTLLLFLLSISCFSQVYSYDKKQVKLSDYWVIQQVTGVIVINNYDIAIAENKIITSFVVNKVTVFGDDYKIYYCTDKNNKKVRFLTVGESKNKKEFQLIFSTPSVYWKVDLVKIE
jgi:hypothetical protein